MPENSLPSPDFNATLLVRTDYSDDRAWQRMVDAIQTPSEEGFTATVTIVDDPAWAGADQDRLASALPEGYEQTLLIVSDSYAQTGPGFPLLVTDINTSPMQTMRVSAQSLWAVESNLNEANMDWEDYANHTDSDGVYRGSV